MQKKISAIFVDRDGTLIEDKHYLSNPAGISLFSDVGKGLKKIQENGISIFIVTNQSGIGRGYFKVSDLMACQKELENQLNVFDVKIRDMAFCPHSPENTEFSEKCFCRKPQLGMWKELSTKHHLNSQSCAMIGDKKEDLAFGINAGFAMSFLVSTGKGLESAKKLNLHFQEETFEFSPDILENTKTQKNSSTKCFAVHSFSQFVDKVLEYNQNLCT